MATKTKRTESLYTFYYREPLYPHHRVTIDIKLTGYPRRCGAWKRLQKMFNNYEAHSIGYTINGGLY